MFYIFSKVFPIKNQFQFFILGRKENGNPFYNAPYQTKNIQNVLLLPNIGLSKIKDKVLSSAALSIYL